LLLEPPRREACLRAGPLLLMTMTWTAAEAVIQIALPRRRGAKKEKTNDQPHAPGNAALIAIESQPSECRSGASGSGPARVSSG
jgi:hypothetical protein